MSNYKASDELTDTLAQNKRAIEYQHKKIATVIPPRLESAGSPDRSFMVADLETLISEDNYHNYDSTLWTEGHVAEEVAHMASLLARQRALIDAQGMIARENKENNG